MSDERRERVERACEELTQQGQTVTFSAVAKRSRVARATLYRHDELRTAVERYRREADTFPSVRDLAADMRVLQALVVDLASAALGDDAALGRVELTVTRLRRIGTDA